MKFTYSLIKIILVVALISYTQSLTKCGDDLKLDTCYLSGMEGETTVTYVKACGKGKKCQESSVGICIKQKDKLEEGKKCITPLECRSGICTNKKCAIKKENEACTEENECGKSAYCLMSWNFGVCKSLSGKEGDCTSVQQCQIGLTCSNNKCVEKFSLEVGSETNLEEACKTGKTRGGKCVIYTEVDKTCVSKNDGSK